MFKNIIENTRRGIIGEDDERSILDDITQNTSFSWSTRIQGFIVCFLIGTVFSLLGTFFFWGPKGLVLFAVFYTLGNIMSLSSTLFLMGPCKQLQNMFKETRLITTIIYIVCMIFTLLAAFLWKKKILVLIFCIMQFLALIWYSLSYIPYARNVVRSSFLSCV
ncbi:unnamed protein product [Gordionus sp. m RMFG-2023]|uniref:vesicle transport protein SFT2B-like n=1 Tax=Gordionus sp. m RMFG-2023 TaxID=3053472 RepID=UPI0030E06263